MRGWGSPSILFIRIKVNDDNVLLFLGFFYSIYLNQCLFTNTFFHQRNEITQFEWTTVAQVDYLIAQWTIHRPAVVERVGKSASEWVFTVLLSCFVDCIITNQRNTFLQNDDRQHNMILFLP